MNENIFSLLPKLTQVDLDDVSEGNLDPLGLYAIADSLAVQLAPGVRERQSHPAYLIAMAVTAAVCDVWDDDVLASDGVSPSWQVFEWYVTEGLVRRQTDEKPLVGLPGREKVGRAIRDRVPVSFSSYLKTASVFGFNGVYRLLAKTLDIVNDNRLGDTGYRLLVAWEQQRGLAGFYTEQLDRDRRVSSLCKNLRAAVDEGLANAQVSRGAQWSGWDFFFEYLHPADLSDAESDIITQALMDDSLGFRDEVIRFLISEDGRRAWEASDERLFHNALLPSASEKFAGLIKAIQSYETFACTLQSCFDDCLYYLSQSKRQTSFGELAQLDSVQVSCKTISGYYDEAVQQLIAFNEAGRFERQFAVFAEPASPELWVEQLLDHHRLNQSNKPPNGRAPWLDWFDNGKVMVRVGYFRDQPGDSSPHYIHAYRTTPLHSFAKDLRLYR